MEKILRKIKCGERLPVEFGSYLGKVKTKHNEGKIKFGEGSDFLWLLNIEYWYEEISITDLLIQTTVDMFTEEQKESYRNVSSRMLENEANERYKKALDSLGESHWTSSIQDFDDLCKILKIAAGLEEN